MSFIDGFVAPVTTSNQSVYREHAEQAGRLFKEFGALQVVDAWGEDVPDGKLTSFPMSVKLAAGETVVFGWIVWPSREVRDEGWKRAMADPRLQALDMPFDGKRMIHGGFSLLAES